MRPLTTTSPRLRQRRQTSALEIWCSLPRGPRRHSPARSSAAPLPTTARVPEGAPADPETPSRPSTRSCRATAAAGEEPRGGRQRRLFDAARVRPLLRRRPRSSCSSAAAAEADADASSPAFEAPAPADSSGANHSLVLQAAGGPSFFFAAAAAAVALLLFFFFLGRRRPCSPRRHPQRGRARCAAPAEAEADGNGRL